MGRHELSEAFTALVDYVVEGLPVGWERMTLAIEFVSSDVVKLSGDYRPDAGRTTPLAFDCDAAALAERIRQALDLPHQEQVRGLHLSLEASGAMAAEFAYAETP